MFGTSPSHCEIFICKIGNVGGGWCGGEGDEELHERLIERMEFLNMPQKSANPPTLEKQYKCMICGD